MTKDTRSGALRLWSLAGLIPVAYGLLAGGLWTWSPDLAVVIATVAVCLTLTAALRMLGLLSRRSAPPDGISTPTEGGRIHALS